MWCKWNGFSTKSQIKKGDLVIVYNYKSGIEWWVGVLVFFIKISLKYSVRLNQ